MLEESLKMRADVQKQGPRMQVAVGLQGIQSSVIRKVKQIIDTGKLGKILSTTVIGNLPRESRFWQPESLDSHSYVLDNSNGATFLSIMIAHHFGNLLHLLGTFQSISATASVQYPITPIYASQASNEVVKTAHSTSFDQYSISGALKSGAHASITWRSGYKNTPGRLQLLWIINGEEGSIKFESDNTIPPGSLMQIIAPKVIVNGRPLDEYLTAEGIGYSDPGLVVEDNERGTAVEFVGMQWMQLANVIRGGNGEFATLDDAIEVQKVVEAVEKSVELGGLSVKVL